MSSDLQPFQPRSEFVRTEATPQTYTLVALNGADTLRCHNISPAALSALREVFGQEMRLYGENAESQVAEFVFRSNPWSTKTTRSEILITNIFTVLLMHQYTFLTTIDYGRQYLDKLSLTFARPTSISTPTPASESIFALSFTAPTVLRVLNAPLHATPAILQSVRGTWPRGVKGERKLGGGSWEFRLKGFGYFSTEKSDESILPHVFTLLRALDAHAFRLVAAVPIGGRSRSKDLWIFTAPGVSSTGSGSVAGSVGVGASNPASPYQPTIDSEWTYTSGPSSPLAGHAKSATDEPAQVGFGMGGMAGVGSGHKRSSSAPVNGTGGGGSVVRKPVPALTPPRGSPSQSPGGKGTPGARGSPVTKTTPVPSPAGMAMPVPTIPPPLGPASPASLTPTQSPQSFTPTQSPAQSSTPLGSSPTMVPVPIPPQKRNSSLLRKFRAGGGSGRTASGRFNHPPPPPTVRNANGGSPPNVPNGTAVGNGMGGIPERKRTIVSGEVIYETPPPGSSGSPTPNTGPSPVPPVTPPAPGVGFVPPPPPPPIPQSPVGVDSRAPVMPVPTFPPTLPPAPVLAPPSLSSASAPGDAPERPGMLTPANRTTEELLLPRGAFRDSAFSASTDQSHDVAVAWTGPGSLGSGGLGNIAAGGFGGKAGDLEGVTEGEGEGEEVNGVEARSPDVTRTIHDDGRPKSERAELALAAAPAPAPVESKQEKEKEKEKKEPRRPSVNSKTSAPNEWVFVSVDKSGKNESESSGASPPPPPPLAASPEPSAPPELEGTGTGSFKRWFGRGQKPKEVVVGAGKTKRRRGGMAQALRSSKRLTIE